MHFAVLVTFHWDAATRERFEDCGHPQDSLTITFCVYDTREAAEGFIAEKRFTPPSKYNCTRVDYKVEVRE